MLLPCTSSTALVPRKILPMRVSLAALAAQPEPHVYDLPISVQVKPSRGMMGEHHYSTSSITLRNMLKRQTDLSLIVIDQFMTELRSSSTARLSGLELSDRTLKEIGFFVD